MSKKAEGKVVVEPIVVLSLAPTVTDPEITALLPKSGEHPIRAVINILGINNAIANGIRRALVTEMDNYALLLKQDSWRTNDEFLNIDFISDRVRLIPVTRDLVKEGMQFILDAVNDTNDPMSVKTKLLRAQNAQGNPIKLKELPFFETIEIACLLPHKELHFTVEIISANGMADSAFSTAFTAQSIPFDERPTDITDATRSTSTASAASDTISTPLAPLPYPDKARAVQSASLSNAHNFQIIFECVGKGDPSEILRRAIDSLISRARAISSATMIVGQEKQAGSSTAQAMGVSVAEDIIGLHMIKMPGETHTIGNLFMKCCTDIYPDVDFVSYHIDDLSGELSIRIRTTGEPVEKLRDTVVAYIIRKYEEIKSQI